MKAEDFRKSIDELYARLIALTETKGEEYKRREDNQFSNFERGAHALGLTREQVLMVYLSKHLDSITTYVKDRAAGQEKQYAEPISGRIDDAILYLLLLRGMTVDNDQEFARRVMASIEAGARNECDHDWGDADQAQVCRKCGVHIGLVDAPEFAEDRFPERVPLSSLEARRVPVQGHMPARDWFESCGDHNNLEPVGLNRALDPITEAFRQMAAGGAVGGHPEPARDDNARPSVEPGAVEGYENTVFISSMQSAAIAECKKVGLSPAGCALSTPDQLYGMKPGTRVIFLHHGNKNCDFLHDEVRAKCLRDHLVFEVWYP